MKILVINAGSSSVKYQLIDMTNDALLAKGHSIVVVEHNLDVIKIADHIIDLGPEGGEEGGEIVAVGTPSEVAKCKKSHTAKYLKKVSSE